MRKWMEGISTPKKITSLAVAGFMAIGSHAAPVIKAMDAGNQEKKLQFIENKGQWNKEARYMAYLNGGAVFLSNDGFMYDYYDQNRFNKIAELWHDGKPVENEYYGHHSFKVNFVNANTG